MTQKQTLLDYLSIPNPEIRGKTCARGSNSRSKSNAWDMPTALNEWEDFEFDTLTAIFNGELYRVLQEKFDLQNFSKVPFFPFRQYFDENSLESLLIKWNQSIVTEALEKSQAKLQAKHRVFMVRGGQAKFSSSEIKWRPDWACVQLRPSVIMERQQNLLPGETKVSDKWSSEVIEIGPTEHNDMSMDAMRPLMQIYSYCLINQSRYGYIITDKELVAVRVRLNEESDSQRTFEGFGPVDSMEQDSIADRAREAGVLDFKAIPWDMDPDIDSQSSQKNLTVNLGLWWLHILATCNNAIADARTYGALKDENSDIWRSKTPDLETLALSQSRATPSHNGKKRAKPRGNNRKFPIDRRANKDGIIKRGRSQGPRSAKNSFEHR